MTTPSNANAPEAKPSEATSSPLLPALLSPLFDLGKVVATPGALGALRDGLTAPAPLLDRHQRGDWGDLDAHDRAVNRQALLAGERLLSSYLLPESNEKIWIITEADRSVTTLLLPSEY